MIEEFRMGFSGPKRPAEGFEKEMLGVQRKGSAPTAHVPQLRAPTGQGGSWRLSWEQ